jgi:hypothetical protein
MNPRCRISSPSRETEEKIASLGEEVVGDGGAMVAAAGGTESWEP